MPKPAPGKSQREGLTIVQMIDMFPTEEAATEWFESVIWPNGRHCPKCGSENTCNAIIPAGAKWRGQNVPATIRWKCPTSIALIRQDFPTLRLIFGGLKNGSQTDMFRAGFGAVCAPDASFSIAWESPANRVVCRECRRKDIKPICDTKNAHERETVAASRKSGKDWNSVRKFVSLPSK